MVTPRPLGLRMAVLAACAAAIGVAAPAAHAEKSTMVRDWPAGDRQVAQYRGETGQLCLVPFEDQAHEAGFVLMKNDAGEFGVVLSNAKTGPGAEQATFTIDGLSHSFQMVPADMQGGPLGFRSAETGEALDFLHDLYNGQTLSVSAGPYHGTYSLAGSARAITTLNQCRDSIVAEALHRTLPQPLTPSPAQTVIGPMKQGDVQLIDDGFGTFQVEASINGSAPMRFILDTGASGVSISQSLADKLIADGKMSVADYRGSTDSELADGSKQRVQIYMLRSVTIGEHTVNDVLATIGGHDDPLLLGQAVLRKFSSWSIDNQRRVLSLNDAIATPPAAAPPPQTIQASAPAAGPAMIPTAAHAAVLAG